MGKRKSGQGMAKFRRGRTFRAKKSKEKMRKFDPFSHRQRQQLEEERKDVNMAPKDEHRKGIAKSGKMTAEKDTVDFFTGGHKLPRSFKTFLLAKELAKQQMQRREKEEEGKKRRRKRMEESQANADVDKEEDDMLALESESDGGDNGDVGNGDVGNDDDDDDDDNIDNDSDNDDLLDIKMQEDGEMRLTRDRGKNKSYYDFYPLDNEPPPKNDGDREAFVSKKKLKSKLYHKEKKEKKRVKQLEKKINTQLAKLASKSTKAVGQMLANTDNMGSDDEMGDAEERVDKKHMRREQQVNDNNDDDDEKMFDRKAFKDDVQAEFALRGFGRDDVEFGEQVERPPDQRVLKTLQKNALARVERKKLQAKINRNHKIRMRMQQINERTGEIADDDDEDNMDSDDDDDDQDTSSNESHSEAGYESFEDDAREEESLKESDKINDMLLKLVQEKKLKEQRENAIKQYRANKLLKKKQGNEATTAQQDWRTFAHHSQSREHTSMDEFN